MTGRIDLPADAAIVDAQVVAPHGHPCGNCGCPVEAGDRFCPACGAAVGRGAPAERAGESSGAIVSAQVVEPRSARYFRCKGCGSEVSVDPDQRSYVCAFCESSYVVEFAPAESGRQEPEFVIGFGVSKEQAQQRFKQWLAASGWFHPGDLKRTAVVERLRGVYLPFWAFTMLAESEWAARIGEHWYRTETYTTTDAQGKTVTQTRQVQETEWWNLSGRHHQFHSGYMVSGSRGLSQSEADQIGPYNLPALRRYASYFLAGWTCEEYSVSSAEAYQRCQQEFYRREQRQIAAFLPGDTHADLEVRTHFRNATSDLCLLPVYVLTYRYGGKLYRFLINGQTGRILGHRPISWARILLVVGGVGLAILLLALAAGLAAR